MPGQIDWLDDDEQRAWRAFLVGTAVVFRRIEEHTKQFGLTIDDYRIVTLLSESPGDRLRMRDVADHVELSRSKLTYRVDGLARRGIVRREDDDDDGRATWARLTPDGRAMIERIAPLHVAEVRRVLIDHFDRDTFLAMGEAFRSASESPSDA